jgi:hypothetical protein
VGWLLSSDVPSNSERCQGSPHKVELTNFVSERELLALLSRYVPSKLKRCRGAHHKVELTHFLNERELFALIEPLAAEVNNLKRCRVSPSFLEEMFEPLVKRSFQKRASRGEKPFIMLIAVT